MDITCYRSHSIPLGVIKGKKLSQGPVKEQIYLSPKGTWLKVEFTQPLLLQAQPHAGMWRDWGVNVRWGNGGLSSPKAPVKAE